MNKLKSHVLEKLQKKNRAFNRRVMKYRHIILQYSDQSMKVSPRPMSIARRYDVPFPLHINITSQKRKHRHCKSVLA